MDWQIMKLWKPLLNGNSKLKLVRNLVWSLVCIILISSCSPNPYAKSNRIHRQQARTYLKELGTFPPEIGLNQELLKNSEEWIGTTNFGLRKPNYVVLHHTAQDSVEQTLKTFTLPRTQVSAHYVIGDDGTIYHMLNDYYRAWHAGNGTWGNNTDLNSSSIGIELDNNGFEPFSEAQISSLIDLLAILKEKYKIPTENFIGHSDMAPSRKVDPNPTFPWKRLAEEGFGHWYDEDILNPEVVIDATVPGSIRIDGAVTDTLSVKENKFPDQPDPRVALRIIGYDTSDLEAAIKAFKLHFVQSDLSGELTEKDLKILYNLYLKYL